MKGKGASNFCVFLTEGRELFVKCFHRYTNGNLIERQRYVFAKDGCVRYIYNEYSREWRIATKFREPRFASEYYPYSFDNSYCILNADAYHQSDMRYCPLSGYRQYMMQFMRLYVRHPNIEYLIKSGYGHLIYTYEYYGYFGYALEGYYRVHDAVDLRSNNLLRMLHLNRDEFKLLRGKERFYQNYLSFRHEYPKSKPHELLQIARIYGGDHGRLQNHIKKTGLSAYRIACYMDQRNIDPGDYSDYLDQCTRLKYDLRDTAISMPREFYAMHERLSELLETEADKGTKRMFRENYAKRKRFEFEYGDLFLRQPITINEIIREGKILCHCVGGYAERHAKGFTNIFFVRKKDDPDKPFYTMEVGTDYRIVQCRGYRNDRFSEKPETVITFEKQYQEYLKELQNVERNQRAVQQSA